MFVRARRAVMSCGSAARSAFSVSLHDERARERLRALQANKNRRTAIVRRR
jgi:hypothetical protein